LSPGNRGCGCAASRPGRPAELIPQRPYEGFQRLLHLGRQREVAGQHIARTLRQPVAPAAPAGQNIENIDVGVGEPRKIIGAQLTSVILIEALLGDVDADQIAELCLLQAEPLAFFGEAGSKAHRF
jgi:hypothetical protein